MRLLGRNPRGNARALSPFFNAYVKKGKRNHWLRFLRKLLSFVLFYNYCLDGSGDVCGALER